MSPRAPRPFQPVLALFGLLILALGSSGCVTQSELNQARRDDLRYMSRVIGYAVDANEVALQSRLTILRAFEKDAKFELLVRELGTIKENEERLRRVRDAKLEIVSEGQQRIQGLLAETED